MSIDAKVKAVSDEIAACARQGREIIEKAKAEGRGITGDDRRTLEGLLGKAEQLKADRESLLEGNEDAAEIRAKLDIAGSRGGWEAVAKSFVDARKGGHRDFVLDTTLGKILG